jgi:hypothetical protein
VGQVLSPRAAVAGFWRLIRDAADAFVGITAPDTRMVFSGSLGPAKFESFALCAGVAACRYEAGEHDDGDYRECSVFCGSDRRVAWQLQREWELLRRAFTLGLLSVPTPWAVQMSPCRM